MRASGRRGYAISRTSCGVLDLQQSRKSWALELGLTHEALYRALAKMGNEGVLSIAGSRLALRRLSARAGRRR